MRSLNSLVNFPGPKYKKVSFSNSGHAFNLASRLNKLFKTDKFTVIKLLQGEIIVEGKKTLFLNGDDPQTRLQLATANSQFLLQLVTDYDTIVIDEAQRIENVGVVVKMLIDAKLNKQFILTGSSSLDLGNKINEPLTGRKWEHQLFPLSWSEVKNHYLFPNAYSRLEEFLNYGMYPEVVTNTDKKKPKDATVVMASAAKPKAPI